MFTQTFKYYKSKQNLPKFDSVIDFDNVEKAVFKPFDKPLSSIYDCQHQGLTSPSNWNIYTLPTNPGLIFIQNPFTPLGQRYWIARCLRDYPKPPHVVNLTNIKSIPPEVTLDWWSYFQKCSAYNGERLKLKSAMRWVTLGYHHDWNSKVYSENKKHAFPPDLAELSAYIADVLGFGSYCAQAAIVNFYPIGTTLAGHTDHSEKDLDAPLFSFSFGQTAIFLIGGQTKDVKPSALFLKSGDIVVMSRESRLCYHAVPKIMPAFNTPWYLFDDNGIFTNDLDISDKATEAKKRKLNIKTSNSMDIDLWHSLSNLMVWKHFEEYIKDCRININVRQVLKDGETSL